MARASSRVLASALAILGGLGGAAALAQEQDEKTYQGTWSVRLQGADGSARDATLVLDRFDGTWQDRKGAGRGARNACGVKKIPLTVQASTRTFLAFTVWGDSVSPACPTLTVIVRPAGEKRLEGTADLGSHGDENPAVYASHAGAAQAAATPPAASAAKDPKLMGSAGSVRLTRR